MGDDHSTDNETPKDALKIFCTVKGVSGWSRPPWEARMVGWRIPKTPLSRPVTTEQGVTTCALILQACEYLCSPVRVSARKIEIISKAF